MSPIWYAERLQKQHQSGSHAGSFLVISYMLYVTSYMLQLYITPYLLLLTTYR